jgi:predicted transcriptional regulator
MATTNNVHVPDDLLSQAEELAKRQGRSRDDIAADALKRYLAHEWLNKMERDGQEQRQKHGLGTEEDINCVVERAVSDYRSGR